MHQRLLRTAFTTVELLVVISIIALMAALLLPAVQWARERSRQATCANNLRQIGLAVQQHNGLWQIFPNAGGYDPNTTTPTASWNLARTETGGSQSKPLGAKQQDWGWAYQLLPHLEMDAYYKETPPNAAATVVPVFFCPTRRKATALLGSGCGIAGTGPRGAIDYAGNGGYGNKVGGKWSPIWPARPGPDLTTSPSPPALNAYAYPAASCDSFADGAIVPRKAAAGATGDTQASLAHENSLSLSDIRDGASNTILAGERWFNPRSTSTDPTEDNGFAAGYTWDTIRWGYYPISNDYTTVSAGGPATEDYTKFGAAHRTVCHFVLCDGSTRPMSYTVDPLVFRAICARNDHQSPDVPGLE